MITFDIRIHKNKPLSATLPRYGVFVLVQRMNSVHSTVVSGDLKVSRVLELSKVKCTVVIKVT